MNTDLQLCINICLGLLKLAIAVFVFYEADRIINKLIEKKRRRKRTPSE